MSSKRPRLRPFPADR